MNDDGSRTPPSSEKQVLRYAADLAALYSRAAKDRRALEGLEQLLMELAQTSLDLVRALSVEEAGKRLTALATQQLRAQDAALYLAEGERFALLTQQPADSGYPTIAPVSPADLAALEGEVDELSSPPWSRLVQAEGPLIVLPLTGRRRAVGFLVGRGSLSVQRAGELSLLNLLGRQTGVVVENLQLEARRSGKFAWRRRKPGAEAVESDLGRVQEDEGLLNMVGRSPGMQKLFGLIERLAKVDSSVLVQGETGTGKALVARALHDVGPRRERPFVTINCAAIPDALVESELFGHEAGSFTGATRQHRGRVEQAAGGTLFLDEIGELPLAVQTKLLTFLEDRTFTRVGGEKELTADVRVISATNRDLQAAVEAKEFRSDLLYRLNVFTLHAPPLRERGDDVLRIAARIARTVAERYELPAAEFGPACQRSLLAYDWPGNVRELRNVIEKAVILANGDPITPDLLPVQANTPGQPENPLGSEGSQAAPAALVLEEGLTFSEAKSQVVERWEQSLIEGLLRETQGNIAQAARLAKMDKKHLRQKLQAYGIDAEDFREP